MANENAAADELALLPSAGMCTIALALYCAAKGWTLGKALADPPAGSTDAQVLAYQDAKAAIFRELREYEAWEAGSLGKAEYWAEPPSLSPKPSGGGGGPGGGAHDAGVPNTADGLLTALMAMGTANPTSLIAAIGNPKYKPLLDAIKTFLPASATPTVTTPVLPPVP